MLLCFGALAAVPAIPAIAETKTVTIKGTKFNPAGVTVSPGDTVVWKNEDKAAHTVTFDDRDYHPDCVQTLLGPMNCMDPGDTVERSFDQPGDYRYKCKLHPQMTGLVTVKASEATTTTVAAPVTTEPPTTVTTASTTTTTRKLATSSTLAPTTTSTAPADTTTTLTPSEAPAFDPGDGSGDGDSDAASPASSGGNGGESDAGTVALIVAALLAVAGGGGVLLWHLRPRGIQP
jgi:plastocyanin